MAEEEKSGVKGGGVVVDDAKKNDLLQLGQQRAEAVQNLLKEKYGIAHNRLLISAPGKTQSRLCCCRCNRLKLVREVVSVGVAYRHALTLFFAASRSK